MATEHIVLAPGPGKRRCDFCNDGEPTHCFLADDVALVLEKPDLSEEARRVVLASDPHWGACDQCAVLVEAMDKQALHDRCLAAFNRREGGSSPLNAISLKLIQETMFWGLYRGKQHPVAAHQERVEI